MKKISMIITSLGLVLTFSTYAMAASFPDVDEAKWGWAKPMIEEMSSKGIIAGYEDKTFKPAQGVTKIECLILMARILGVNDKSNAEYVSLAEKAYADTLKGYNISYKKEISFLLYKDILASDELASYIGDANANTVAKRYEAAILLTKAMGAEKEVKSKVVSVLTFQDAAAIPSQAKAYVEYVRNQNIMQGISGTEFGPTVDVNRAMMAVMLYKVMQKNQDNKIEANIVSTDESSNSMVVKASGNSQKTYQLTDNTILRMDGAPTKVSGFPQDAEVTITLRGDQVFMVEGVTPVKVETIQGVVADIVKSGSSRRIAVNKDGKYSSGVREVLIDDNVTVTYNGQSATLDSVYQYDTVTVTARNNKAVKIIAESKTKEVSGKIVRITTDSTIKVKVQLKDGTTQEYGVTDDITVRRNSKSSDLKSVVSGDTALITLEYDKIKSMEASSDRRTVKGTIEEITISKTPTITIKDDDGSDTYSLKWDMSIDIDGTNSQIYDLRLGYQAEVSLDSNTVTALEAKKVDEIKQITGRVELVNESYYMLNVAVTGADNKTATQQIFVKKDAKIINSNSTSSKDYEMDDIDQGDIITAVGSVGTGVFEATTVIIIQESK